MRKHLSYANVTATLALVLAVAGGSTAIAMQAAKNSVDHRAIKKGAVRASELGKTTTVKNTVIGTGASEAVASCAKKQRLLTGGGVAVGSGSGVSAALTASQPGNNKWAARGKADASVPVSTTAIAVCLKK